MRTRILLLAAMLMTTLPATAEMGPAPTVDVVEAGVLEVAAGETLVLARPTVVRADVVRVLGAIEVLHGGDLRIEAREAIEVLGAVLVHPAPAATLVAESLDGDALTLRGADGARGGSVVLQAPRVHVGPDALVRAGAGGAGAAARFLGPERDGVAVATTMGGRGGDGGDVVVLADEARVLGFLVPGAGGAGGDAATVFPDVGHGRGTDAVALGGDGGATGTMTVNGGAVPATPESPFLVSRGGTGGFGLAYAAPNSGEATWAAAACGANGAGGFSASAQGLNGGPGQDGQTVTAQAESAGHGSAGCAGGGTGGSGGNGGSATAGGGNGGPSACCFGGDGGGATANAGRGGHGAVGGTGADGQHGARGATPLSPNGGNGGAGGAGGTGGNG
ncbi:MAG TPA: hypothetical protein VNX21_08500, partial [Candidatus Thermoplasmatota archaeon]|nr:hypothetical protein [Candidatus Thermoplasmatota archaeon]